MIRIKAFSVLFGKMGIKNVWVLKREENMSKYQKT